MELMIGWPVEELPVVELTVVKLPVAHETVHRHAINISPFFIIPSLNSLFT
jgi:hypothetical protein